jgi:membrane protein implicated in regulation of membrane protease activity
VATGVQENRREKLRSPSTSPASVYNTRMSVEPSVLWWHWLAFGLVLIGAELIVPSFTIVWFGLAACLVGVLLFLVPTRALGLQVFIWAAASAACTFFWFRYFKPKMLDRTTSGMSREAIVGQTGMLLVGVASHLERGRIRFAVPVLGAEEWDCISRDVLRAGDYARVTGIEGHVLNVEKNPSHS